jgi:hypothetical protein
MFSIWLAFTGTVIANLCWDVWYMEVGPEYKKNFEVNIEVKKKTAPVSRSQISVKLSVN